MDEKKITLDTYSLNHAKDCVRKAIYFHNRLNFYFRITRDIYDEFDSNDFLTPTTAVNIYTVKGKYHLLMTDPYYGYEIDDVKYVDNSDNYIKYKKTIKLINHYEYFIFFKTLQDALNFELEYKYSIKEQNKELNHLQELFRKEDMLLRYYHKTEIDNISKRFLNCGYFDKKNRNNLTKKHGKLIMCYFRSKKKYIRV